MKNLIFEGKGLFIYSDPGGAKPVLALVESLKEVLTSYKVISDREYDFAKNFEVKLSSTTLSPLQELETYKPDFLFTGTSYTSDIEYKYVEAAQKLGIPSFSFVDHWTSIRERFTSKEIETLPDKILVIDEKAKKIAIEDGLNAEIINVFENPYYQWLKKWKPSVSKQEFFESMGITMPVKKIALYAPDPLSNVDGFSKFGFDECSASEILMDTVVELKGKFNFICNLHPNQKPEILLPIISKEMFIVPKGSDINTLIYYSDVVIGFFSNFLIEATIMRKPVIRFFPKEISNDPFGHLTIGKIVYPETVIKELNLLS